MNRFEKRSKENYDKLAKGYDDSFEGKFTEGFKAALLRHMAVAEGASVLDVACGNGRLLRMLEKRYAIVGSGADISGEMVACAREASPSMRFEEAPCDALPFAQSSFDCAVVCAAFHHFPDPAGFAREALRVLRNGGTLYIAEVYYPAVLRVLFNPFVRLSGAGDVKFYAPGDLRRILEASGFRDVCIATEGNIQIVRAVKPSD